ncbi:hypothetical protein [Dactylosporangium sp. NPDC048998]|uniref:hypothetical protein n=1 Tax=Dactylosporangium sp. NPDC048998 TaxID=3363976 RepID=UPI00371DB8D1
MFTAAPAAIVQEVPGLPAMARVLVLPDEAPAASRFMLGLAGRAVDAARRAGRNQVVVAVCDACECCDTYGHAVNMQAASAGMDLTVFLAAGGTISRPRPAAAAASTVAGRPGPNGHIIDGSYADAVAVSKRHAAQIGAADANVPGPHGNHGMWALAVHLVDLLGCLPEPPTAIWTPLDELVPALDAALLLMGWPATLTAVTRQPPPGVRLLRPAAAWPDSPLYQQLGSRDGANWIIEAGDDQAEHARRLLADAGITTTATAALGLAGLLNTTDRRAPGRAPAGEAEAGQQLVLVAPSSAADVTGPRQ